MLVLVLDTSTPAVTAALVRVRPAPVDQADGRQADGRQADGHRADGRAAAPPETGASQGVDVLAERATVDARAHGELLAPSVAEVLAQGGARPADLAAVVAGLGPGPFTGLRVGLVTAASLGQALAIPTYGVCSLDGIGALTTEPTLVATDARRKEIYWAVYDKGTRLTEPAVNRPADLPAILDELGRDRVRVVGAVGDGARMYAGVLGLPLETHLIYPAPLAIAEAAADRVRTGAPSEPLHPLYLRRPDAVEPGAPKLVRQ